MRILLLSCFAMLVSAVHAVESLKVFRPCPNVTVNVSADRSGVEYKILAQDVRRKKIVALEIEVQPKIEIDDFNFDGLNDFAVWYIDEGMGKYTVHRVFIYDPRALDFFEVTPDCGDEFIDLKVDKAKKRLKSTYFADGLPLVCSTTIKRSEK
jgi:hypothetical protein